MKQFLKIFLMLIALFILPFGCGGGSDNYIDYGEDEEYHESSPDEFYEEPVSTELSDKEIKKLLKKYPDWRTNPQEFAEQAFVSGNTENVENSLVKYLNSYILRNAAYANSIGMNADPAGITIGRVDQHNSPKAIDKEFLLIEKMQTIFNLDPYEAEAYPLTKYFHLFDPKAKSPYVSGSLDHFKFYKVSLARIKKNGKRDIVWSKIYPSFKARYDSDVETNHVWIDERLKDFSYYFDFFKKDFNKILYNTITQEYYKTYNNFQNSLTNSYDTRLYSNFTAYSNYQRSSHFIDDYLERHYFIDITPTEFLNNKNYTFSEEKLRNLIRTWHGGVDEFEALKNKYKKYVVKTSEFIVIERPVDITQNVYSYFVDDIFNLYIDYTYNKKLPPKK